MKFQEDRPEKKQPMPGLSSGPGGQRNQEGAGKEKLVSVSGVSVSGYCL